MDIPQAVEPAAPKPLRLWPGVAIVALQWLIRFVAPMVVPEATLFAFLGGAVGGLAVMVWWAFFSRAPRLERWGGVLLMIATLFAARPILHKSIATGMMGLMFAVYAIPILSLAFVLWAIFSRRLSDVPRRVSIVVMMVLVCGGWALLRTEGITGEGVADFSWRWTKTPEERLVAQASPQLAALPAAAPAARIVPENRPPIHKAEEPSVNWPGFRGPGRDSIISGIQIRTDWATSKPVELWRRPVGPGWSSFAVRGNLLYTQEQRGEDEVVACYNAATGKPVWVHRDAARFWESNGGPGPRATPTLHGGRVYTFGATGILNAIDATDGKVFWSHNAASDTGVKIPAWGFASSPLVVDDLVVVATGGKLAAYDAASGALRWLGMAGGGGYSSPHHYILGGVAQIVLMSGKGVTSVAPADGKLLWKYDWPTGTRIVQPGLTADGDLLISGGEGSGIRRVAAVHGPGGWTAEERWVSLGLKPYFNDFVVHDGHVFGFDGAILACIDAKDGKRKWKGGRYGHGQLVLLRDQGLLLVLSEEGEIALVRAATDQFTELARLPALEGKTWNHPVLAGDRLFVRNGNEMVAFKLSFAAL